MTFSDLNLNTSLLNALNDLGYQTPTTIQAKSFSVMMSGQDVIGIAQTGTGKTIAYLLPCLKQWKFSQDKNPQILIVVPTRELVVQVVEVVQQLTKYMNVIVVGVYGGTNIKTQAAVVYDGLDVLVATPGRLIDLILNGTLRMKSIKRLVLDEVDEMMNLGFRAQLTRILDLLPPKRQNLLFSATMTDDVEKLIDTFFRHPVKIEAAPTGTPLENIVQMGFKVPNFYTKVNLLEYFLDHDPEMDKVIIFTATKKLADQLGDQLEINYPDQFGVVHSNKSQAVRFENVNKFKDGTFRFLIATDIVARGIDISEVSHVINFDIPEIPENYMHRIGRTGRADKKGIAITFITKKEAKSQSAIESLMKKKIPISPLPEDLLISVELTEDELARPAMPAPKIVKREPSGPAFHEKSKKNSKVNNKIRKEEAMRIKYGKPQTKGDKGSAKKK
jgi:ATP-dependent RNA helicase RhlE